MLIDTHCHINMMVKKEFDTLLQPSQITLAQAIIQRAYNEDVTKIINVGTSLVESKNCVALAIAYPGCYATVGIHPNDCTATWHDDLKEMRKLWFAKGQETYNDVKIVGIGECGIDRHYPDYNLQRQKDAFKAQIELALEFDLPLSVHSRNAPEETLYSLDEFRKEKLRGVIHCFSEDKSFADEALKLGMVLGIGGTVTYPKNEIVRSLVATLPLDAFILETDAPFLPPQAIRGKQNNPAQIKTIAQFIAELRNVDLDTIASSTTKTVLKIFKLIAQI
jgi:TatD DNase family protein